MVALPGPNIGLETIIVADPVTLLYAQIAGNRAGQMSVNTGGLLATYRAAKRALALAATPTLVMELVGAASTILRVRRITVSGAAATASQIIPVDIIKYSAVSTVGTKSTITAVPDDSAFAAAGGVCSAFTVNPTVGTPVGTIGNKPVSFGLVTAAVIGDQAVWDFTTRNDSGLIIRGIAESVGIHLAGVTLTNATTLNFEIEWSEEASS